VADSGWVLANTVVPVNTHNWDTFTPSLAATRCSTHSATRRRGASVNYERFCTPSVLEVYIKGALEF
jgi:hypothetical protein